MARRLIFGQRKMTLKSEQITLIGDIVVDTSLVIHEDLVVEGNAEVDQNMLINGPTTIHNTLHVDGDVEMDGNLTVHQDLIVDNDTTISGQTLLHSTLHVDDDVEMDSNIYLQPSTTTTGVIYQFDLPLLHTADGVDTGTSTFVGLDAGKIPVATASIQNSGVGSLCLSKLSSGAENTAIGYRAADSVTSGDRNTIIGALAGTGFTNGDDNILIGHSSGSTLNDGDSNNILIGNGGTSISNQIALGDTSHTTLTLYGVQNPAPNTPQLLHFDPTTRNVGRLTTTSNSVLISNNSNVVSWSGSGTTGQVLTATSGAPPSWSTPVPYSVEYGLYRNSVNVSTSTTSPGVELGFDTVDAAMTSLSFTTPTFTCVTAGIFTFNASVSWASSSTGYRRIGFRLNGSSDFIGGTTYLSPTGALLQSCSWSFSLAINDTVTVFVRQTAGTLDVIGGAETASMITRCSVIRH